MTDPRQPHNQEAIDLAASFRLALESTRNEQYQVTTVPSLVFLQHWIASSQALQPGSASNPVQIFDDAPVKSDPDSVDISQVIPRELLEPQYIVPENPPHILRHHHPASGLGNSSAILSSSPAFSSQPCLFSASASAAASVTPPSSNLSVISGPSVPHNSSQATPSRIGNATVCSRCKQSGHVAEDHCSTCGETGHDFSTAHCYHCHRIGKCTTRYCVNTRCTRCNEIGHPASQHCQKCSLPTHSIYDHCNVCDEVGCKAEKHCNVCEEVGHTSKDHCELCRDRGHTENDHCVKCKQLGHGFHACLESDPVSIDLCWTCRNYGHHRDWCRYRQQDELRVKWAYQLNRKLMHAYDYCKCCREQGAPDRHKFAACPRMTHRVGCLKKNHINSECIQWMDRSRKKGSYKDASTQADLAEYSTEVDPRGFDKSEERTSVPTYHLPPNIFTVVSTSTQTAFVRLPLDGEMTTLYEIDPMLLDEQSGELDPFAEIDPVLLGEQSSIKQEIAEIDPELLDEQSPIKQETTTLEEPEAEIHNDDTVWNFEGDWRDYSRIVGPLRNASRTLGDEYWDDRVSQERPQVYSPDMIMPTQDQRETFEQAAMTPVIRKPSIDREERGCGPSPEQSINPVAEHPLTRSEWWNLQIARELIRLHKEKERNSSEESDDLVIVDDYPPDPPDDQEEPSGRSPIRSFSEIRNERAPRFFVVHHAPEVNVAVASSSAGGEKRLRQPTSAVQADKRQKTTSDPSIPCSATTSDTTQNEGVTPSPTGGKRPREPPATVTAEKRQKTTSEPQTPCLPGNDDSTRATATRNLNAEITPSTVGEKRPRRLVVMVLIDNRQKTTSDPKTSHPATTSSTSQGGANKDLTEGVHAPESNAEVASDDIDEMQSINSATTVAADKRQRTTLAPGTPRLATTSNTLQQKSNKSLIEGASASESNAEVAPNNIGEKSSREPQPTVPAEKRQEPTSGQETSRLAITDNITKQKTNNELNQISTVPADKRQKTTSDPIIPRPATSINTSQRAITIILNEGVWLDHELHIQWQDLCYMVIFDAPNHSTNLKQLYNLISNWLRSYFPTHTSIHNRSDIAYLEKIMHASSYIETRELNPASVEQNPIQFSIHELAIPKVKKLVKMFSIKLATFKYQMCWKKYQFPGDKIKFRSRISFEHLVGMALHQAVAGRLTIDAIVEWIATNVDGYNCKELDRKVWIFGLKDEIRASSFFEFGSGGLRFREGCGEFFDKRDLKIIFPPSRDAEGDQAS